MLFATATLLVLTCCTKKSSAQTATVDLRLDVKAPFHFVAYGDTRFHDPKIRKRPILLCVWRSWRP